MTARDEQKQTVSGAATTVSVVVWLLLVVSLLSWRSGVYYSGGFDLVVIAKGCLSVVACVLALDTLSRQRPDFPLGLRSVGFVAAFVLTSLVGAASAQNLFASTVLSARVVLVVVTVAILVVACTPEVLMRSLSIACGSIGLVCAVTGAPTLLHGERLSGGLLPLAPNQIGLLVGLPMIWALWKMANREPRLGDAAIVGVGLGITFLTGSRSGLAAMLAAGLVILAMARRLRFGGLLALILAAPAVFYLVTFTGTVSKYFGRGGSASVTTLNSRTIAWRSAFQLAEGQWQRWFGGGYSIKVVPVSGAYWDTQVLDSSWVSAFVQAGYIGLLVLALWSLSTLWRAWALQGTDYKSLWLALALYAVLRSFLETGLLDSYMLVLVILVPSLAVDLKRGDAPGHLTPAWEEAQVTSPTPM